MKPRMHMVIPDCQVRPGVPLDHLRWVGNYAAEKRPDVIIDLGDFSDLRSLSSYDVGKVSAEGKRYADDVAVTKEADRLLTAPIIAADRSRKKRTRRIKCLGNHEQRADREGENNPKFKGYISSDDLGYEQTGWEVHPFLDVVRVNDIDYSHYFTSGPMGRPVSSARALLARRNSSAVMGHVPIIDIAVHAVTQQIAIFAGICYQHSEGHLPQANNTKAGIWMLHEVHDGTFDPMFVSLGFLKRRYS